MFCHLFLEFSSFVPVSVRAYKQSIRRCEKIAIKGKKKQAKKKQNKTKQNKRYSSGTEGLLTIFAISTGEHVHCSTDFRKRVVLVQLSQYNGSVFRCFLLLLLLLLKF